jgi:hypothetical protein
MVMGPTVRWPRVHLLHGYHNYGTRTEQMDGGWDRRWASQESTYRMVQLPVREQSRWMVMGGTGNRSLAKESTYCMGTITTGTRTEQM